MTLAAQHSDRDHVAKVRLVDDVLLQGETALRIGLKDLSVHRRCHAGGPRAQAEPELRTGNAAGEIIDAATESAADLIIVGSRGQTGLKRTLLGSVARNVLSGSDASVLVVRAAPEA